MLILRSALTSEYNCVLKPLSYGLIYDLTENIGDSFVDLLVNSNVKVFLWVSNELLLLFQAAPLFIKFKIVLWTNSFWGAGINVMLSFILNEVSSSITTLDEGFSQVS